MSCCGGRGRAKQGRAIPRTAPAAAMRVGREGMKLLEFVGGSTGSSTYWGDVTGQRYVFGNNDRHRIKYVDIDDADALLDLWKGHRPLFSVYVAPKEETIKVDAGEVARVQGREVDSEHYLDATPSALKLADTEGVDLSLINGSGKDGRIVKRDVEEFLSVLA